MANSHARLMWIAALVLLPLSAPAQSPQPQTFRMSNTTPNCRDTSTVSHQVCLPAGERVGHISVKTTNASGNRADVVSQQIDPSRPNCATIVTSVAPFGEDCANLGFSKVCNCKGRGWIEVEVTLTPG